MWAFVYTNTADVDYYYLSKFVGLRVAFNLFDISEDVIVYDACTSFCMSMNINHSKYLIQKTVALHLQLLICLLAVTRPVSDYLASN